LRELEFDDNIIAIIQVKASEFAAYWKITLRTCNSMTKIIVFTLLK